MTRVRRFVFALAICGSVWVVPASAHASDGLPYTVRDGDSLYGIATRSGVSVGDLLDANGLTLESVILPGQQLSIPTTATSSGSGSSGSSYTVVWGDSLSGIAGRHGVGLGSLLQANGLTVASVILPGMNLQLPAGATTPAGTPAPTNTPAATGSSASSYTVVWGDSLSGIAGRHGVGLGSLLQANDLTVASVILPGMNLQLPAGASTPANTPTAASNTTLSSPGSSGTGSSYTVVWGDSLSGIAGRHGVKLGSLLQANGLTVASVILPGMHLQLPAGASTPTATTVPATAPTTAPAATGSTGSAGSSVDERVDAVVRYAIAQQGKPYKFFTKGPSTFDCSGLTLAAYAQAGISLAHYSAAQAHQGREVDLSSEAIEPGDLVFLKRRGSATINHVGIAITADTWVQAVGTGDVVRAGPMPARNTIVAVRRFINQ